MAKNTHKIFFHNSSMNEARENSTLLKSIIRQESKQIPFLHQMQQYGQIAISARKTLKARRYMGCMFV